MHFQGRMPHAILSVAPWIHASVRPVGHSGELVGRRIGIDIIDRSRCVDAKGGPTGPSCPTSRRERKELIEIETRERMTDALAAPRMEVIAPSPPLIQIHDVVKTYESEAGEFTALRGVNAAIGRGQFVSVVGKSGAGKSTLVNMITSVDHLTSGEIIIDGTSVHDLGENQVSLWRGRNLGVIYQSFELLPMLSLLENVMLPMDFCGLYHPRKSPERAMHLLSQVGLADHVHKPPTRISGGQQQRVAIARALANDPAIILADEPTGNLDSATADEIVRLFEDLVSQGRTVIMVTHDESLARRATHRLRIADGEIVDESHG